MVSTIVRTWEWLIGHFVPWAVVAWAVAFAGVWMGWWQVQAHWGVYFLCTILAGMLAMAWMRSVRERFIREAALPQFLKRKLRDAYPHLNQKEAELVERGLRQFFIACLRSRKKFVAMPSQAVDVLWHEFILHTKAYQRWCQGGLGFFLHHTPAEALGKRAQHNDGLRRAWYWACKDEAIDPRTATRLPLLFAIDAKLQISNGFFYVPDCAGGDITRRNAQGGSSQAPYCGTDFTDGSYSGSTDDFGGADSTSTHGGSGCSDGGGDGGDGGGGGCGGGGD